jgi:hypothetical protein
MKPELKTTLGDVIYLTDRAAPTRYETPRASSSALSAKRAARELLTVSREPRGTQVIGDELHDRKKSIELRCQLAQLAAKIERSPHSVNAIQIIGNLVVRPISGTPPEC